MTAVIVILLIALCWLPVLRLVWWLTWRCGMPVPGRRDHTQRKEARWKRDYESVWMRDCSDEWLKAHGITGLRAWWWRHFR